MNRRIGLATAGVLFFLTSCATNQQSETTSNLKKTAFGKASTGEAVDLYTFSNSKGVEAAITNYGGIIVSLKTPDRNGKTADVVLGFDSLEGYLGDHPYFGAIIGRYGNRIAKGKFSLNGQEYSLAKNNGENHLHGGIRGFDKVVWRAKEDPASNSLALSYLSKDGEEGYPGNLAVNVTYTLTDDNELKIEYTATTDKATVVNLTNHSYFDLRGQGQGDILGHRILIAADRFTPVDSGLIPTGELRHVEGTAFDFRQPRAIGERINAAEEQIQIGKGYDHNFVLNQRGGELALAARASEPESGRVMEVHTTEPGVQFYTGNFLDGTVRGKSGKPYPQRSGFCLETQHFPDSPNKPNFPTVVLKPGDRYRTTTVYRFTTDSQ
jgi:aldose 1-epimerase